MTTRLTLMLTTLALGTSCAGVPLPREQLTHPGALLFNGYARETIKCFICHNGDATGARGPSLARDVRSHGTEKLAAIIRKGPGLMPSYPPEKLNDEELGQVVEWLKATFPAESK